MMEPEYPESGPRYTRRKIISSGLAVTSAAASNLSLAVGSPARHSVSSSPSVEKAIFLVTEGVRLRSKHFYDKGSRYQNECYQASIDRKPGSRASAYLRVNGKRESLIYRASPGADQVVVAQDTYILSPIFAAGHLIWVELIGKEWKMRAVQLDTVEKGLIIEPFPTAGRPMSLSTWDQGDSTWLAWEERSGRRTCIRIAAIRNGHFEAPVNVTDGSLNAYDPAGCTTRSGVSYLIYCAFAGNYRIHLQKLTAEGKPDGAPQRISDQPGACLYPSVASGKTGGLWFAYTAFDSFDGEQTFLNSFRHLAQHHVVMSNGRIMAGVYDRGELWAPLAPSGPGAIQGFQAAGRVHPSRHAGHNQIIETASGRVALIYRQHGPQPASRFEHEDAPLTRAGDLGGGPSTNPPDLCFSLLRDPPHGWSEPIRLVSRAHLEAPISSVLDADTLRVAFTEDSRQTGWSHGAEYFDEIGQLGVGCLVLDLSGLKKPQYELRPYALRPTESLSIEEPSADRLKGKYLCVLGETHRHSGISVCRRETDREPNLVYRFMQDVMRNDFGCLTDHCYNQWYVESLLMRKLAEYYYFPGEFVAIPAYEWTGSHPECTHDGGPFGHMNPLWLEEEGDLEVYTPCDPQSPGRSPRPLWSNYKDRHVVTLPHHPVDNVHAWYWRDYDPTFMPVVELFQSIRGSAEQPRAPGVTNWMHRPDWPWVVDVLKKGLRLGFIASSDHGGIARAGLLVSELTRTGLYEAFMARRTFGTTCADCSLEFTCNGRQMGEEVSAVDGDFRLRINAAEPIRRIQIVRDGEEFDARLPDAKNFEDTWKASRKRSGEFWYCRAILASGDIIWTSSIWLI